jgi:hypothetical protein
MIALVRRPIAILSGLALLASVAIYVASFDGQTLDEMRFWPFALHLGIFALFVPMCVIEYSPMTQRIFFMKGFAIGKPTWVVPGIQILGIFYFAHIVLFLVLSHAASP